MFDIWNKINKWWPLTFIVGLKNLRYFSKYMVCSFLGKLSLCTLYLNEFLNGYVSSARVLREKKRQWSHDCHLFCCNGGVSCHGVLLPFHVLSQPWSDTSREDGDSFRSKYYRDVCVGWLSRSNFVLSLVESILKYPCLNVNIALYVILLIQPWN